MTGRERVALAAATALAVNCGQALASPTGVWRSKSPIVMAGYDHELAQIVAELNRAAAPGTRTPQLDPAQGSASLDQLLAYAAGRSASDLLLIAGAPVALRIDGKLAAAAGPHLGADDTRNLLLPLLTPVQYQELQRNKAVDFCFSREA